MSVYEYGCSGDFGKQVQECIGLAGLAYETKSRFSPLPFARLLFRLPLVAYVVMAVRQDQVCGNGC